MIGGLLRRPRPKVAILFFLPVLVGICFFYLIDYSPREDRHPGKAAPRSPAPSRPGGEGLVLEVFSTDGERLWSLFFQAAELTGEEEIVARKITGRYYASKPAATFRAAELLYDPAKKTLSLSGVIIDGPLGRIHAGKVDWREGESFQLAGGYFLEKDGLTVTGERLSLAEDFSSFRALGSVRLRWPGEGK